MSEKDRMMVMSLTGVDEETARQALATYLTVDCAVEALFVKPVVSGEKYLPPKPQIDDGLTEEQRALCFKGRDLQDKVNVVYSVAHSKTRTPQDLSAPEASEEVQGSQTTSVAVAVPMTTASQ
jgi:hypothetical protein